MATKKFYCYVDETGQDTLGNLFIVTVVIPENRDEVLEYLEKVEIQSGKEKFKWGKADPGKRLSYIKIILSQRKYPLKTINLLLEMLLKRNLKRKTRN